MFPWIGFEEGYDALERDIGRSMLNTFPVNLARWFAYLSDFPEAAAVVQALEEPIDFGEWISRARATATGEIGEATLSWSHIPEVLLGQRLALARAFAEGRETALDICFDFMWARDNSGEASVRRVNEQIIQPMLGDLKRHLRRRLEGADDSSHAPASDRVVWLDHNSEPYRELFEAVNRLAEAVRGENGFATAEEKQRAEAEIEASRVVLALPQARTSVLEVTLGGVAAWLMRQFSGLLTGVAASAVYAGLQRLLSGG